MFAKFCYIWIYAYLGEDVEVKSLHDKKQVWASPLLIF